MTDTTIAQPDTASTQAAADDFDTIASMGSAAFLEQQAGETQSGSADAPATADTQPPAASAEPIPDDGRGSGNSVNSAGQETSVTLDWSAVPPEFRAAHEAAQRAADEGAQYRRSNEGRLTAHQHKVANLERELAAIRAANGSAAQVPHAGRDADAALSNVKALAKDYPELAPVISAVETLAESNKAAEARFARMDQEQQQAALESNAAALDKLHPGWDREVGTPAYLRWYENSPEFIKDAVRQHQAGIRDPQSAAYLFGLYKSQTAQAPSPAPTINLTAERRKQQLAGAASVNAGSRGAAEGPPADDYDANFDHFARRSTLNR